MKMVNNSTVRKTISIFLSVILCFSMLPLNVAFADGDALRAAAVEVDDTLHFEDLIKDGEKLIAFVPDEDDEKPGVFWVGENEVTLQVNENYKLVTNYDPAKPSSFSLDKAKTATTIKVSSGLIPEKADSATMTYYFMDKEEATKLYKMSVIVKQDATAPVVSNFACSSTFYDEYWVERATDSTDETAYIDQSEAGILSFKVTDDGSGIDPDSVKVTDSTGAVFGSFDSETMVYKLKNDNSGTGSLPFINDETFDFETYELTATDAVGNKIGPVKLSELLDENFPRKVVSRYLDSSSLPKVSGNYEDLIDLTSSPSLYNYGNDKVFWFSKDVNDRQRRIYPISTIDSRYVFINYADYSTLTIKDVKKSRYQKEYKDITRPETEVKDGTTTYKDYKETVYLYEKESSEGTNRSTELMYVPFKVKVDEDLPATTNFEASQNYYGQTVAEDGTPQTSLFILKDAPDVKLTFELNDASSGLNVDTVKLQDRGENNIGTFEKAEENSGKVKFDVKFESGVYDLSSYTLTANDNAGNVTQVTLDKIAEGSLGTKLVVMEQPKTEYSFNGKNEKHPKYYKKSKVEAENGVKLSMQDNLDEDAYKILLQENPVVYKHVVTDEVDSDNDAEINVKFRDIVSEDWQKKYCYVNVDEGLHEFKPANDDLFNYQNTTQARQTFIVDDTPPLFNIQNYNASKTLDYAGLTVYPNEDDAKIAWKLTEVGTEPGFWNLAVTIGDTLYAGGYEQFGQTLKPIVEADSEVRPLDTIINTKDMTAYGCDMAGNEVATDFYTSMKNDTKFGEAAPTQLFVDSAAPTIKLTYDKKMSAPGYFNQKTNATLTVTEGSFGILKENEPRKVVAHVTKSGWTRDVRAEEFQEVNGVWQFVYALDYDGSFAFSSDDNFTDIAGKHFAKKLSESVILDTIAPSISVTFDNNECSEPTYFNAQRTATVVVRDKNIDSSLIKTQISNGVLLNWSASEEDCTWTAKVNFANEGECRIVVDATDRATNASKTPFDSDVFTLDFTAPSVSIQRIDDYHAYNDVCAPMIVYSDTNFDSARTTYKITGAVHGESYFMSDRVEASNSLTIDFSDIDHILEYDDVYTIEAEVEDKAGNKATALKRFSVNRFGSNYILSDKTKEILGKQLNYAPEIEVTEINVSGIIDSKTCVMVAKGSDVVSLNSDEYERRRNADAAWDECTYVLPAETFDSDDYYRVLFSSYDTATNIASNSHEYKDVERKNSAPVEFVVDMTNPVSSFLSLENERTRFAPSVNENLFLDDNLNAEGAWLKVDGEVQESYSADDLKASNVKTVNLTAVDRPQSLELVTKDVAGNVSITKLDGVVITNNPFIYWFYTPRLFYGTIAGLLVLAGVISMCVWLHKKNRKYVDMSMSRLIGMNRD